MKLDEFRIGLEFYCAGRRWRCTDVGSRVVVAICLEPHEIESIGVADRETGVKARHIADDSSWFDGPPFAVAEHVFDDYDIEACALVPDSDTGETVLS